MRASETAIDLLCVRKDIQTKSSIHTQLRTNSANCKRSKTARRLPWFELLPQPKRVRLGKSNLRAIAHDFPTITGSSKHFSYIQINHIHSQREATMTNFHRGNSTYVLGRCLLRHLWHSFTVKTSSQPICIRLMELCKDTTWVIISLIKSNERGSEGQMARASFGSSRRARNSFSFKTCSKWPNVWTRGITSMFCWAQ